MTQIAFQNAPSQYGIEFPCGNTYLGSGIAFFDYDNDVWEYLTKAFSSGHVIYFFDKNWLFFLFLVGFKLMAHAFDKIFFIVLDINTTSRA
jgi:hypothetical protein